MLKVCGRVRYRYPLQYRKLFYKSKYVRQHSCRCVLTFMGCVSSVIRIRYLHLCWPGSISLVSRFLTGSLSRHWLAGIPGTPLTFPTPLRAFKLSKLHPKASLPLRQHSSCVRHPDRSLSAMSHMINALATPEQLYQRSSFGSLPTDLQDSIFFSTQCLTQAAGLLLKLPQSVTAQANVLLARYWLVEPILAHEFSVCPFPFNLLVQVMGAGWRALQGPGKKI